MLERAAITRAAGAGRLPGAVSARGRERPVPAAVRVRDDLRDAIASLRVGPGAAIGEKDLAQAYGVSRTPVRETLAKLVQEGLVGVFPQAGTFVSRIPFHDLPEALGVLFGHLLGEPVHVARSVVRVTNTISGER